MSAKTSPGTILFSSRFTRSIGRRVLHYIRKHKLITEGERIVVAVSGGPDSTALLTILSRLGPFRLHITVAHFNHQLRTEEEAAADLSFVRSLAFSLGLPLAHSSVDVRAFARKNHLSIEDAARRLRYAFLSAQCSTVGASSVAVGHTLDDQAETVLLHLIRGAGLAGVSGMQPRTQWPFDAGPEVARPLLALRRAETERYCRETGVTPRSDPTNDLPTATRNRVRNEVMPALRCLNPSIEESLTRFAVAASADAQYLDELAAQAFIAIAISDGSRITLPRRELASLPGSLASRLIRLTFARVRGTAADLEAAHIDGVLEALHRSPGRHSLPDGVIATIDQTSLILTRGPLTPSAVIAPAALPVPGQVVGGAYEIEARLEPPPVTLKSGDPLQAYLDADKAGAGLSVRSRRPGDRLRPLGLGGEKKLQDILVDAKVPARDRDAVPLVCAGDQIAWVVGHCIDERYALDSASRRAIHLLANN